MAGRPKKEIDYTLAESLARIMCTQEEIAAVMNCSVRTLQRDSEFCRVYKKGLDYGKMSIRRMQIDAAKKGNASLLIFLGKNYLGQRDNVEQVNENNTNTQIQEIAKLINKPKKPRTEEDLNV